MLREQVRLNRQDAKGAKLFQKEILAFCAPLR
jgi:hypothetical protein